MAENLDWVDIKNIKRYGDPSSGGDGGWHPDYTEDNPPDFDNMEVFHPLTVFNTNTMWYVPRDGWYRIVCIGTAGKSSFGPQFISPESVFYSDGPGGGGTGGIAISHLYLKQGETYNIVNNGTTTSFGSLLSATAGGSSQAVQTNNGEPDYPVSSYGGEAGTATGGNYINIKGKRGGDGGRGGFQQYHIQGYIVYRASAISGKMSEDGHVGGNASGEKMPGGQGGYCDYTAPPIISRYHFSYPANTDVSSRNLVDVTNKRIVFGTSAGYQSPGRFTGCVIIETAGNI